MKFELFNINPDKDGYEIIIRFGQTLKNCFLEDVTISLKSWFSANMLAVLGATIYKYHPLIDVKIDADNKLLSLLRRNEFLAHFGYDKTRDYYDTVIKYKEFKSKDDSSFKEYVIKELFSKSCFPILSEELKGRMIESVYEIFINAKMHSESENVYTCGQYYSKKGFLEFTIVDAGVGIKKTILSKPIGANNNITDIKAIQLATSKGYTTKNSAGGLGLYLLIDFIRLNQGKIQIISGNGFYELDEGDEKEITLNNSFEGTIVNIKINTNDRKNYKLSHE